MTTEFQYDVFLSHNSADKSRVRRQAFLYQPSTLNHQPALGLERSTVLFRDLANAGRCFIPVLLADCKLPDTLRRYEYVGFRREN